LTVCSEEAVLELTCPRIVGNIERATSLICSGAQKSYERNCEINPQLRLGYNATMSGREMEYSAR
jgi:hypothetical protein